MSEEVALQAVVVTVSDGVAQGAREDRSGNAVAQLLQDEGFYVIGREVVPDEQARIESVLRRLQDETVPLIVTTGPETRTNDHPHHHHSDHDHPHQDHPEDDHEPTSLEAQLAARRKAGQPTVLGTAVKTEGNPPCRVGQKILLGPNGALAGTLG